MQPRSIIALALGLALSGQAAGCGPEPFEPFAGPRPVVVFIETNAWPDVPDAPRVVIYENGTAIFARRVGDGLAYHRATLDEQGLREVRDRIAPALLLEGVQAYDTGPDAEDQPEARIYLRDGERAVATSVDGLTCAGTKPDGSEPGGPPAALLELHRWLCELDYAKSEEWVPAFVEARLCGYVSATEPSILWPQEFPGLDSQRAVDQGDGGDSIFLDGSQLPRLRAFLATRRRHGAVELDGQKRQVVYRYTFPNEPEWRTAHDALMVERYRARLQALARGETRPTASHAAKGFDPFAGPRPVAVLIETDPWGDVRSTPRVAIYENGDVIFARRVDDRLTYRRTHLDEHALRVVRERLAPALRSEDNLRLYDVAYGVTDQPSALIYLRDGDRAFTTAVYGLRCDRASYGRPEPDAPPPPSALLELHHWLCELDYAASDEWIPSYVEVRLWDYSYAPEASIQWAAEFPGLASERAFPTGEDNYAVFLDGSQLPRLRALLATRNPKGALEVEGRKLAAAYRHTFPSEPEWLEAQGMLVSTSNRLLLSAWPCWSHRLEEDE